MHINSIKRLLMAAAVALPLWANAQSGTNSPYSQYGFGLLSEQMSGFNSGMAGVALGFSGGDIVNRQNPASYSRIDSLTFIFDMGVSGQLTNFKENGKKVNARNADFEYAVAAFRMFKGFGVSFGLVPLTNVGYDFSATNVISPDGTTSSTARYDGSGGIHQVYLGAGWSPWKPLSIGFNAAYIWGDLNRYVVNSYTDTYMNTLTKASTVSIKSWKLDFGLQYTQAFGKKDDVTLGLTFGLGHKVSGDPESRIVSQSSAARVADTALVSLKGPILKLPYSAGAGLMWSHNNQVKVGADYEYMRWSSVNFPTFSNGNAALEGNPLSDRHKVSMGGEVVPNPRSRSILARTAYRVGASYASSYYKINGADGPRDISVTAGMAIPIINSYNNRSVLNISGEWTNRKAKGLIDENTFRINIGFTFNEQWFAKWKAE